MFYEKSIFLLKEIMLKYDKKIKIESLEKLSDETLNFLQNFNHVVFTNYFNKSIDNLPLSITKLELGDYFKQSLDFLPINLEELTLKKISQEQINNLPPNLKVLNLRFLEEDVIFNDKMEIISFDDFNSMDRIKNKIYSFYYYKGRTYFLLKENKRDFCKIYIFKDIKIKDFITKNSRFYFDLQDGDLILDTGGYCKRLYIIKDKLGEKEMLFFDDENNFTRDFDFTELLDNFSTFENFSVYYWENIIIDKEYSEVTIYNLERLFHYHVEVHFDKTLCTKEYFDEYLVKISYPNNEFYIYLQTEELKRLFEKYYLMNKPVLCVKPSRDIFLRYSDKKQIVEFFP